MKLRVALLVLTLLTASTLVLSQAKKNAAPANPPAANPAFEKIKSLAGDWETKSPEGTVITSFRVVSAGSAVLITHQEPNNRGDMITVVHPDGPRLMATHYCSAKNQPRFLAVPSGDPNKIVFELKDITNLSSPEAGHMVGVVFTIVDADHHNETWTFRQGGKDQSETFQATRKK